MDRYCSHGLTWDTDCPRCDLAGAQMWKRFAVAQLERALQDEKNAIRRINSLPTRELPAGVLTPSQVPGTVTRVDLTSKG